jgi:cytochrome c oxidase subunit 2
MSPLNELNPGDFRLLEVDNRTVLPLITNVRLVITRRDVLHSWALPRIGLKVDANPGRLNIINFFRPVVGLFYGQCREICGANHSFIPICVEVTNFFLFKE